MDKEIIEDWINIDQELPERYTPVLACNEFDKWVCICFMKDKHWYNTNYAELGPKSEVPVFPTHWMPLPKPFNSNSQKEGGK